MIHTQAETQCSSWDRNRSTLRQKRNTSMCCDFGSATSEDGSVDRADDRAAQGTFRDEGVAAAEAGPQLRMQEMIMIKKME